MICKVVSVTVLYNPDINLLERQLLSLENQVSKMVLVDNGSSNIKEIEVMISNNFKNITMITLPENVGLAKGQNIGIVHAIEVEECDNVLLLDQDSVLASDFVKVMLGLNEQLTFEGHKVGAIGPEFYDPVSKVTYPPTRYRGPFIIRKSPTKATEVTFLIASGCFFSKDVYLDVGPMEDQLFVDYIDVDWSLRCKAKGYSMLMTNLTSMEHTIGDNRVNILGRTIAVHSPIRRYYLIRNSFFMLRQSYIPVGYKLREVVFNLLRAIVGVVYSANRLETLKFMFKGLGDGIANRFGPYQR